MSVHTINDTDIRLYESSTEVQNMSRDNYLDSEFAAEESSFDVWEGLFRPADEATFSKQDGFSLTCFENSQESMAIGIETGDQEPSPKQNCETGMTFTDDIGADPFHQNDSATQQPQQAFDHNVVIAHLPPQPYFSSTIDYGPSPNAPTTNLIWPTIGLPTCQSTAYSGGSSTSTSRCSSNSNSTRSGGSSPLPVMRGTRGQLSYDTANMDERRRRQLLTNRETARRAGERRQERRRSEQEALARCAAENAVLRAQLAAALRRVAEIRGAPL